MQSFNLAWRQILILFFCSLSFQSIGQTDKRPGLLDIRNDIRTLWQKSFKEIAPNMDALPIFDSRKSAPGALNFTTNNDQVGQFSIIQDNRAESYFLFHNVSLEKGESLNFSSPDDLWPGQIVDHNRLSREGNLFIGPLNGDIVISHSDRSEYSLQLDQVYSNPLNIGAMELGFDASFECHININCEVGGQFAKEKRSVMRIRMVAEEGVALCTGTLLNNTSEDQTPYVLTAYHCILPPDTTITPLFDMWLFDFNYEGLSCADPESEPIPVVVQGAEKLASWEDTDMMLLQMTGQIPSQANVFFAGWNRDTSYLPQTTYMIHHPVGDIKKISIDDQPGKVHERTIGWNNGSISPENSHYINDFDQATYEPGSSGASIMDENGHVLGQLHGGPLSDETCSLGIGYSGRVSVSWNTGESANDRLRDWLDPEGLSPDILEGINATQDQSLRITGKVTTADGIAISNVRVNMTGDKTASLLTGTDGRFVFDNLLASETYQISITKNSNVGNGLSSIDLVIIKNHIVANRFIEDNFKLMAADVNNDERISSADLVQIKNVIIGRSDSFPLGPSWDFEPNMIEVGGSSNNSGAMEINIIGYKLGDVNNSAQPGN